MCRLKSHESQPTSLFALSCSHLGHESPIKEILPSVVSFFLLMLHPCQGDTTNVSIVRSLDETCNSNKLIRSRKTSDSSARCTFESVFMTASRGLASPCHSILVSRPAPWSSSSQPATADVHERRERRVCRSQNKQVVSTIVLLV